MKEARNIDALQLAVLENATRRKKWTSQGKQTIEAHQPALSIGFTRLLPSIEVATQEVVCSKFHVRKAGVARRMPCAVHASSSAVIPSLM